MRCLDWLYAWGWRKRALLLAALAQWLTALGVLLFVTPEFQGYAIGLTAYLLLSVLLILLLWDRRSIRVMVRGVSIALLSSSFLLTVIGAVGGTGTNGLKPPVESLAYLACTFFQMTLLSVYPALAVAACRDGRLERIALRFAAAAECISHGERFWRQNGLRTLMWRCISRSLPSFSFWLPAPRLFSRSCFVRKTMA